jgi:hypothetical protein
MNNLIDFKELLNWNYLTLPGAGIPGYDRIILFVLISAALLCIPLFFLSRKKITGMRLLRQLYRRIGLFLFFTDIFGFVVYFSRMQGLPIFSLHIMLLIWAMILILGGIILIIYMIVRFPKSLDLYRKEELKRKYLPKKGGV